MKIGIISINMYTKGLNFASPLHTYAFQQFLLKYGIDSTVISYTPIYYDNFDLEHPYDYYKKRLDSLQKKKPQNEEERLALQDKILDLEERCRNWKELYREREIRYRKFQDFIDSRYIRTQEIYNSDLLEVKDPGMDCYICATDVIWKNEPGFGFDRGFFLASTCMEGKWKIAYAGSCNARKPESEEEKTQFFSLLEDIDFLSVREASLKRYIDVNMERKHESTLVLDPVLLHEASFYEDFLIKPKEEHYLLLYYVMEKARATIEKAVEYARLHNMTIVEISDRAETGGRLADETEVKVIFRYDVGIEEWLGYLKYADIIFTNSFHACCFSVLFEKQFFVGFRHGDKVKGFLKLFGLEDRIISRDTDVERDLPAPVDFEKVRNILSRRRRWSAWFLLDSIQIAQERKRPEHDYLSAKKALKYRVLYNSGIHSNQFEWTYSPEQGTVKRLPTGTVEFWPSGKKIKNDGSSCFLANGFELKGYQFTGWNVRLRIDNRWFWYLEDGTLSCKDTYDSKNEPPKKVFTDRETVPYIPVNRISIMVAEAVWEIRPKEDKKDLLSHVFSRLKNS